jgi:hypothetical protein
MGFTRPLLGPLGVHELNGNQLGLYVAEPPSILKSPKFCPIGVLTQDFGQNNFFFFLFLHSSYVSRCILDELERRGPRFVGISEHGNSHPDLSHLRFSLSSQSWSFNKNWERNRCQPAGKSQNSHGRLPRLSHRIRPCSHDVAIFLRFVTKIGIDGLMVYVLYNTDWMVQVDREG